MKKLLFTAMACVAFAFNGLASNEVVESSVFFNNEFSIEENNSESIDEEFAPCQVEFWVFDAEGGLLEFVHKLTDTPTMGDCYSFAGELMRGYELAFPGSTISDVVIEY